MVGKEEQRSGVRDAQTWVSRTKRTLRRRGYFPSLESSPPAGGISPKSKTEISPCGASFFLSDQKETKESPGADSPCQGEMSRSDRGGRDRGFWERPAANALVFQEPHPRTPLFTGDPEGSVGSRVRRGNLGKGAYAYSLPFCSVDETGASTRCNAPKWFNIHRGQ